tara:strand:- start:173 stop:358 length:186 start_codon:yes stop_codon:yes gene_type:complete
MSFIKDFFKKRKHKKISKKISQLQEQAMIYQRNGNLRGLADIVEQISNLEKELVSDISLTK